MASPADIEYRIAKQRDRLASTVDELVSRAHPKAVAKSKVERVKKFVDSHCCDNKGNIRKDRALIAGGVVAVVAALAVIIGIKRR